MRALMTLIICFGTFVLIAQVNVKKDFPLQELVVTNDYVESALHFEKLAQNKPFTDLYFNAACYWSLAGDKSNAIRCLLLAADEGFRFEQWLLNEEDLKILHRTKEWRPLLEKVRKNHEAFEMKLLRIKQPCKKKEVNESPTDLNINEEEFADGSNDN